MTNYKGYITDLARQDAEYRTSIKKFVSDIKAMGLDDRFREDIRQIGIHHNIYDVAYDYSIPVTLVKYFQKYFKEQIA